MTSNATQLLEDALRLPERERADLAVALIDSLDPVVDSECEAAWDTEIARRVQELDDGTVTPVPWWEVRQKLRRRLHAESDH
jgi:putative addiction module component (TIGR02574 family)